MARPLHIGVNALYLIPGGVGGTEIYLRSLLPQMALQGDHRFTVYVNPETGTDLVDSTSHLRLKTQPVPASFRPGRLLWEQTGLACQVWRDGVDVLFNPGFTAPAIASCPCVTTFHDLQHKRHPEHFRWFDLPFWNLFLGISARTATRLLADSSATAADLRHYYGIPAERIDLVPLAAEEVFFSIAERRRAHPPGRKQLLCVSTLHPHKNIERLVEAFADVAKDDPEPTLTLAGMRGFHGDVVERRIRSVGLADRVRITGWLPRSEVYDLYEQAWAFVYPSTFEGFGLPVVEALAAGIPTACSSIAPLQEIAGQAALQFPPQDTQRLADCLRTLLYDDTVRSRLAQAGPEQAGLFSWRRAAEQTLASLQRAVTRRA